MKNGNSKNSVKRLTLLGLLTAVLFIMAYTPLGYLNAGPLAITFNVIPVAIAGLALGPAGGAAIGGVFGLTSFLQCFGGSVLGTALFGISPALAAVQCFAPRILDGFIVGLASEKIREKKSGIAGFAAGFMSAFLNTLFYMSSLLLLFGNTELIRGYRDKVAPGKNAFLFVCAFVGINAVAEWIASTCVTGALGIALGKARLLPDNKKLAFE